MCEQEHLCDGQRVGVRNGEERRRGLHGGKSPRRTSMKLQLRRSAVSNDLDITPEHLLRVAGPERLHGCLLCGKAPREMDGRLTPALAIRDFTFGKDALKKAFAVSFDGGRNSRNIGGIDPQADDVRHDRHDTAGA